MGDEFIRRENIERFRKLLATEADPKRRLVIEGLLATEEKAVRDVAAPTATHISAHKRC